MRSGTRIAGGSTHGCTIGALFVLYAVLLPGCPGPVNLPCGDQVCPEGYRCDLVHEICVLPSQMQDCVGLPDGTQCQVDGVDTFVCDQQVCIPSRCGDGLVDSNQDEECDEGPDNSDTEPDACRADCQAPRCGDSIIDPGEGEFCDGSNLDYRACTDIGFAGGALSCQPDCAFDVSGCNGGCGNGVQEGSEACDGPDLDGRGCTDFGFTGGDLVCDTDCTFSASSVLQCTGGCGNGVPEPGEECDEGPGNSDTEPDACRTDCRLVRCGDGTLDADEECDDGNHKSRDGCSSGCTVETWAWIQAFPTASPPTRCHHSMAYDSARQRVVLFGGQDDGPDLLADTWEHDGTTWVKTTSTLSPPARMNHAMVFDSARGVVVLYGGEDGPFFTDTWEYDGTAWVEATPATAPPGRVGHGMAYDSARGRVVLYGGWAGAGLNTVSDTWEYDGTWWVETTPAASPSARISRMVYDSIRGRMVLFGGFDIDYLSDTWEYYQDAAWPHELCDNGADDDSDGLIDCADPDCELQPCGGSSVCSGGLCQ